MLYISTVRLDANKNEKKIQELQDKIDDMKVVQILIIAAIVCFGIALTLHIIL